MQLSKNGIDIEVADAQVVDLILERLQQDQTLTGPGALPPIGVYWEGQGGFFAGIVRGRDGGPDYALILGRKLLEAGEWRETLQRALAIEVDGHKDFRVPYRNELSVLYANLPDEFEKKWYWSCEQRPGVSGFAYAQHFEDGDQISIGKVNKCLGCAVRMIPLR